MRTTLRERKEKKQGLAPPLKVLKIGVKPGQKKGNVSHLVTEVESSRTASQPHREKDKGKGTTGQDRLGLGC